MTDAPSSRRDFLRGLVRGARGVPALPSADEPVIHPGEPAARAAATPVVLGPDDAERAFAVPADQRDIALALVAAGRLLEATDGRFVEPRQLARRLTAEPIGAATAKWLDRARAGAPPDRSRPQDAILLTAVRAEVGVASGPAVTEGVWE